LLTAGAKLSEMIRPSATELPTGTVTFMFTDVEGSTRLVQQLGESFAEALQQHQVLMRAALAEHSGIEVSTEGDSFFAVFKSATEAVAAAADAQRAHGSFTFVDGAKVRVRMGIHSGIGTRGGDNYVGIDVHRAARIASAAHGGEVIISDPTRALVAANLPRGIAVRDLGLHRLKDLELPEALYQLVIEGIPDDFPLPRSLGSADNLPKPLTTFVGREQEVKELSSLLAETRLLTLTGPGGTGKTRLAVETARRAAGAFHDGAFFVPLDVIRDPALVATAAVQALRVADRKGSDDEALIAHLADRQLLLVFDNFEQVMTASELVDRIIASAPQVRVIVTSRVPLQLYGEQEYRVAPLPTPAVGQSVSVESLSGFAAVELFIARARAVDQSFALTTANATAVAEICVRLDGLPLAIELAAARVKLLPPAAIVDRLGHRLDLLAVQSPNLPARQRTMRAAIDWSWELLADKERSLLERLSVFRGGWDLSAAETVCQPAEIGVDLIDGMGSLLDKSLVVRTQTEAARFTLLQTIGEFAYEQLAAAGQERDAARRHAIYFRDLAETVEPSLVGPDASAATVRLALEEDNIRAALAWAIDAGEAEIGVRLASAVWRFWQQRGQLREARTWLDRLLALQGLADAHALRAKALTAAGGVAYWQGDDAMEGYYSDALAIYRALDDEKGVADSLQNLAFVHMTAQRGVPGAADKGTKLFEESLAIYMALDDKRNIASVTGALGYSRMMAGHPEEARAAVTEAMQLNTALGLRARANDNLFALGLVSLLTGDIKSATEQGRQALVDAREIGDASRLLPRLNAVASLLGTTGHHEEALRIAGAVDRMRDEQGGMLALNPPELRDPVTSARSAGVPETRIAELMADGRSMELDAAVEYALEALPM